MAELTTWTDILQRTDLRGGDCEATYGYMVAERGPTATIRQVGNKIVIKRLRTFRNSGNCFKCLQKNGAVEINAGMRPNLRPDEGVSIIFPDGDDVVLYPKGVHDFNHQTK